MFSSRDFDEIESGLTRLFVLAIVGVGLGAYELVRLIVWALKHISINIR